MTGRFAISTTGYRQPLSHVPIVSCLTAHEDIHAADAAADRWRRAGPPASRCG